MTSAPVLLFDFPPRWSDQWVAPLRAEMPEAEIVVNGVDSYRPEAIDYLLTILPAPGLARSLPNLKVVFSLGAGVDAILADPDYPRHVPLTRFIDPSMARDFAQYVVMHVLVRHRGQRFFDAAQAVNKWRPRPLPRPEDTRIGIMGLGANGRRCAERLRDFDFPVTGWSRTRKDVPGVQSFAGAGELAPFLARSDILVCALPLTKETTGILNAKTFALLPNGAFVINAARGKHLIEDDLVAAIDSGHLSGAVLDVFQIEPLPQMSILWNHPKITVTPHIAALSDARAAAAYVAANIAAHRRGAPLVNQIDLERGY